MTDLTQGDPKITLDENGADLVFKGGQVVMDSGIENAVLISLFSGKPWFANIYAENPDQKIQSRFLDEAAKPITISQLGVIRLAAQSDLRWMLDSRLAKDVIVNITNPRNTNLQVLIGIVPPVGPTRILLIEKYSANWIIQKIDPAHLKVN